MKQKSSGLDPIRAILDAPRDSVLAVIAGVEGPSYRPVGARYGVGSPFLDIELPCGGGLDILLVPKPDKAALGAVAMKQAIRERCSLAIDMDSGAMNVLEAKPTLRTGQRLTVCFDPAIRFLIFGKGPEASTFAALVQSAGYPNVLLFYTAP